MMPAEKRGAAGFSVIEIIVAGAIFLATVAAFTAAYGFLNTLSDRAAERTMAAVLLEEGSEAVLLLRDLGWDSEIAPLALEQGYSLHWDGAAYRLSSSTVPVDGFRRRVTFFAVRRNVSGILAENGAVDAATRRVRIEILRAEGGAALASAEMLIHKHE